MEKYFHRSVFYLPVAVALAFVCGCSFANRVAVNLSTPMIKKMNASFNRNPDIQLMRESMPFTLCGLSGLVDVSPRNNTLLINAAHGYFGYTFAFVEDEDPERARKLYITSRNYALRALFREPPEEIAAMTIDEFNRKIKTLDKRDVPALFWATVSWLSYIYLNLGDFSVYLDIPKAEIMAAKLLKEDETFYFGSPHLLMACYYAAQPEIAGGKPVLAMEHFEKAIELSKGKFLMHQLFYAKFYAVRKQNKELFLNLITKIEQTPEDILPDYCAITNVCKMKAERLKASVDEYF